MIVSNVLACIVGWVNIQHITLNFVDQIIRALAVDTMCQLGPNKVCWD